MSEELSATQGDLSHMIRHHDMKSAHSHGVTHEKLDDVEEELDELNEAIERGKASYHHPSHHSEHHMYDSGASGAGGLFGGGAGGVLGGGIGGFLGSAIGSAFLGRGFGGWGGDGCGPRGRDGGGDCCCVQGAETRIEDAINFGAATNQRFDLQESLGDIKREIAGVGAAVSANINRSLFEMEIANCNRNADNLMAIAQAKFDAVTATKSAETAIIHNQDRIAYEQLKECCERERRDGDRRHSDLNIQVVQNQNVAQAQAQQQQMQLLEERNARRADRHEFQIANIMATVQAQLNQQNVQNKSVTIGSGTSGATSTNTSNNV